MHNLKCPAGNPSPWRRLLPLLILRLLGIFFTFGGRKYMCITLYDTVVLWTLDNHQGWWEWPGCTTFLWALRMYAKMFQQRHKVTYSTLFKINTTAIQPSLPGNFSPSSCQVSTGSEWQGTLAFIQGSYNQVAYKLAFYFTHIKLQGL